ncbi:NADH-quinone oxidoreductase subunit C [Sphingobacterium hungaricum]|uniref:NADH-quinone oxidoreductase subunit C n=1 Tax=Sphingobacterium hungaricum TaxID=2082723 RepID=A0A928V105_9SPHI|nr:NADH-quinone oxidoreductase subunit C [Sphingobacterium hungaricum]MBE8714169.1 NADH-quinone oxidoreductase subunit C [Sphingobacterium hungaricum]
MDKLNNQILLNHLVEKFGDQIQNIGEPHGLLTIETSKDSIIEVLQYLKQDAYLKMNFLTDITAVHYPNQPKAFAVVYHVHAMVYNVRLRIKVFIDGENPSIPTATTVYNGANWMERETYDFFGIQFEGHPDLRRILNMDELDVFPMRREYPLEDPNRIDKKDFYFGR